MLAVLSSAPRPPLGVALLGLLITATSSTLRMLPYTMLCSIIVLSFWLPSRPADPEVMYYPVDGHPQHVHVVYTSPPMDKNGPFELNACLRVLFLLLSVPATAMFENMLFRPSRDIFFQTVEVWYDIRYVQPVLATGSWPDTWTPILNALCSFQFIADFVDGINHTPNLPHERNARPASIQPSAPDCGGTSSRMRPAIRNPSSSCRSVHWKCQRKPDRKHSASPSSVIQRKADDSSDISLSRKTFISLPSVSPSPPCNRGSRASFPISRDLSRMIGVFFRHPTPLKRVPRPRFNIEAKELSAKATNVNFERHSYFTPSAPISPLKASTCDAVIPCPDSMKVPEIVEQIQLTTSSDNVRVSSVPQSAEPQIQTCPWLSVSAFQEERPVQQQFAKSLASHSAPYQEQHIPAYESKHPVSAWSKYSELSMDRPQPTWGAMAFEQQQLSEHMDTDLDFPTSLMHRPEQNASTLESAVLACSPFHVPQDRSSDALQCQLSSVASSFSSAGRSFSYSLPVLQCTSISPIANRQEVLFPPLPQCIPPREPFSTGQCAPKWTTPYPLPATTTLASQTHIIQPLQDVSATETFSFIIDPDTAIPHFAFSERPALAASAFSGHTECIGDMLLDGNHVPQPVSVDYAPTQPIGQNVRSPRSPPASDHQPKAVPQASPPIDSVKAKADDKHNDGSSSDSDTSDSDYTESSEEDSSDSDESSSSEDDEEDASAAIAGPSKVDKGKGKAP